MAEEPNYRLLFEEAERARQEAERAHQAAERARQAAEHDAGVAKLEAERARQEVRETASFTKLLQEELRQHRENIAPQLLRPYLVQASRLHAHLDRLLPPSQPQPPPQPPPQPQPRLVHHAVSAEGSPITSGRTDIAGKYYPLHLRPWADFRDLQRKAFSEICSVLQNSRALPSTSTVKHQEAALLEKLPTGIIHLAGVLNARRTTAFINETQEIPTSVVMNQFLPATDSRREKVFFDVMTSNVPSQSNSASSSDRPSDSPKPPKKTNPDSILLAMQADTGQPNTDADDAPVARRIAVGEHKPCHALRAAVVEQIVGQPMPEDYVVRLARAALARRGSSKSKAAGSSSRSGSQPSGRVGKQTYFAYALTQSFHYMVVSGLEFGFLATGETLTFLRVGHEDPTTLLYHTSYFPVSLPDDGSFVGPVASTPPAAATDLSGEAIASTPSAAATALPDEAALAELAISQFCGFCVLAQRSSARPVDTTVQFLSELAPFPELPPSVAPLPELPPSSLGLRRRDDDDGDGDDGDEGDQGDQGEANLRRRQLRPARGRHVAQARVPSPLQQETAADEGSSGSGGNVQTRARPARRAAKPTLAYCTQACLLGLVQNRELDAACPNYLLHKRDDSGNNRHAVTQKQLAKLARAQLFNSPEVDCQWLRAYGGAIGFMFKITLTGFGYTFVGKGVQAHHHRRLVHESHIYHGLLPQQGTLVPVHLGLIQLAVPYPLQDLFIVLPHMMLMSYAGQPVWHLNDILDEIAGTDATVDDLDKTLAGVDLDQETTRTLQELGDLGLRDDDDNPGNVTWCGEVGRVMKIDFERADLLPLPDLETSQTTDTPPVTVDTPGLDAVEPTPRPEKRPKYDDDGVAAAQDDYQAPGV